MAQSDTDPHAVRNRLIEQLPDHWHVRARYRRTGNERRIEVVLRTNDVTIFVRPFQGSWKVTGESPELRRGCLRILHPEDCERVTLDRCLDRATAVAMRYSEKGSLL